METAKAYFFKGGNYLRYDAVLDHAEAGYPAPIANQWPGLAQAGFDSGLDAAVNWGNGKAYFFKGAQYLRYDIATDKADAGYPTPIGGAWPGVGELGFGTAIQAVLAYEPWFGDGIAINGYFLSKTAQTFLPWFKATQAGQGYWVNVAVTTGPSAELRFLSLWGKIPSIFGTKLITLDQFVALVSIIINETGGTLSPISEKMPAAGAHPGIAYAFDAIPKSPSFPGKASYNKAPNTAALTLFNDSNYNAAHGGLALGAALQKTQDPVWGGQVYPQGSYPTAEDLNQTGYVMQADFYKFRGRGLIQTTFRSGYVKLIQWLQGYGGSNAKVLQYKASWAGQTPDVVATKSTNAHWDDLFLGSDLVIPCAAISLHNKGAGNYLRLSLDQTALLGTGAGSFYNVGAKVSGSTTYATKFRNRVLQILNAL